MNLVIDDLAVAYRGTTTVRPIDGLDMTVADGELVMLHGPSGSGKTTLLSAIAGLLTPERGSIRLGDTDVTEMGRKAQLEYRRRCVGVVFQGFNLLPSLTALGNVITPMSIAGMDRESSVRRATTLLTELGLAERLHHRPGQLSGGQQQRVAIAAALANDPPLLLADEPTAHLDVDQVDVVRATLRSLARPGRTVIVSTHDPRLESVADRVISLVRTSDRSEGHDGQLVGIA